MPQLRPDRLATLYFFHPVRRALSLAAPGIPILMYHSISRRSENGRSAYYSTCTDPEVFAEQVRFLARNGYKTIGLGEAVRRLAKAEQHTDRTVVLTFDDGYGDFYMEAFPVLSRFGYTATVFLPTGFIGYTEQQFNGMPCLIWSQVRDLYHAGIDFGSHTVTHPQLRALANREIEREVRQSKETIEDKLGTSVDSFSYPYAFPEADRAFRRTVRGLLEAAGFRSGVSTIIGTADRSSDALLLERLPVNSGDDAGIFRAKLEGGYDWLHTVQLASKLWAARMSTARAACN